MPNRSAVLLAAAALAVSACAGQRPKPYDPFKVPRDRLHGSLRTVAVAPMRAPADLEDADAVKEKLVGIVLERLHAAGLKTIPPGEVGPILDAAAAKIGGLYDPVTGRLDEAKAKAAREASLAELARRGADALLRVDLRVVAAQLSNDVASWDGVSESVATSFWKSLLVSHSGRVPALSILAFLVGADGTELYAMAGGLRVLGRVNARGQQELTPQAQLFADDAVNARAVGLALDPLLLEVPAQPPAPARPAGPGS